MNMILRVATTLSLILLTGYLAETRRISWDLGFPAILVTLAVAIFLSRIKTVKLGDAEIELFEKQAAEISKAQIEVIKEEATIQKDTLGKLIKDAAESERRLVELQKKIAPRVIDRAAFVKALDGYPTGSVEIMYVRDDNESFQLSLEIRDLLRQAKWIALEPIPIPQSDIPLPSSMSVGGQPVGVSVVANVITQVELLTLQYPYDSTYSDRIKTPWAVLSNAVGVSMGRVAGGPSGNRKVPAGMVRVVVAPKD